MNSYHDCAVIATYNEADNIEALIRELIDLPYMFVIVVDDNSPDGTGNIVQRLAEEGLPVRLISRPGKMGIASAYQDGFVAALSTRPRYVVQMDAGGTHTARDAHRLIQAAHWRHSLIVGSRFARALPTKRGPRMALSLTAAWLMRRLGIQVKDATSGFRCWDACLLGRVLNRPVIARGFAFQLELLYRAWFWGATIIEVPIDPTRYLTGRSTLNARMIREAAAIYLHLWRLRLKKIPC